MTHALLVPGSVRSSLDAKGLNHRPILLTSPTDIDLDGRPESQWLVVTPDHLTVVRGNSDNEVQRAIAWTAVGAIRSVASAGSGLLQVKLDGRWVDLLRYSNALAERFHKVARKLEHMREQGPANSLLFSEEEFEQFDPPRCPECSLRLSSNEESCPRCLQKGQILSRVGDLLRPHLRGAIFLSLLTIVGVVAELIPPKLQQYMVDHVLRAEAAEGARTDFRTALLAVVLALAASRVVLSIVGVVKGRIATYIGTGLTCTLRAQMVQKLQQLAVVYYDRHQVGSTLSRVAHDSEVLHGLMHQLTGGFLLQTVQLVGVGAMLVWLNSKLAMFTLIPVPLVFIGSWVFWKKVYPRHYRLWDASSKQMSVLNGMLSGIRVVKAFAQEGREYDRFQRSSDNLRHWRLWVDQTNARYSAAMQLVFSLGGLIVWYVGGRDVIGKEMSLGELIAFLAYLAMFYAPLSALSNFTTWLTSFLSGSKRVLELLDMPLTIPEPKEPIAWNTPQGAIRFRNVTFGYDRNQPVLKDISFDVRPGEMVGIVGRSGSGKTTIVNLLSRFYDVQEGSVEIDGIDVRKLSTKQLRERLGVVFQDSFLFRGTIWKNLAYGRPTITIEKGLAAAKAAGAHDFILRSALGYETILGERGAGLSGGEKQRLSIARTLLYDPRILVLDEATSSIDAEAEKSIQEALEKLIRGRTTVAIAHRLSTLRNADRILVFDRGRLVEEGSHAELLAQDGVYARLVRIQTQVSKDPSVDRIIQVLDKPHLGDDSLSERSSNQSTSDSEKNQLRWLDSTALFRRGTNGELQVWIDEAGRNSVGELPHPQLVAESAYLVRAFPASHADEYISVRSWNEDGDDVEVGMIRRLDSFAGMDRQLLEESLRRHYLLRRILRLNSLKLQLGFLDFDVQTEVGREQFSIRWTQSQAIDFGERGKMLIDTEENRYVVPDVDAMPADQREKFLQYVYW